MRNYCQINLDRQDGLQGLDRSSFEQFGQAMHQFFLLVGRKTFLQTFGKEVSGQELVDGDAAIRIVALSSVRKTLNVGPPLLLVRISACGQASSSFARPSHVFRSAGTAIAFVPVFAVNS